MILFPNINIYHTYGKKSNIRKYFRRTFFDKQVDIRKTYFALDCIYPFLHKAIIFSGGGGKSNVFYFLRIITI